MRSRHLEIGSFDIKTRNNRPLNRRYGDPVVIDLGAALVRNTTRKSCVFAAAWILDSGIRENIVVVSTANTDRRLDRNDGNIECTHFQVWRNLK